MVNLLVGFLLILSGCATFRADPDCGFYKTEHGENITQHSIPVEFKIHKDVPTYMHDSIKKAAQTYNKVLKEDLLVIVGVDNGPAIPRLDGSNVIYFMPTDEVKHPNNIGLTDLNLRGNRITNSDITINSTADFTIYDLESLMIHEFGHTLGLQHSTNDPESTMTAFTYPGEIKRNLSTKDIINLRCGYL